MKKQTGLWIDGTKAIIVKLSNNKEEIIEIESNLEEKEYHQNESDSGSYMGHTHINHERTFENRRNQITDEYLKNVIEEVKEQDEIYVFGPAETKSKLKKMFEENNLIASKLKKTETSDSMTNNQVVAKVKDFFK